MCELLACKQNEGVPGWLIVVIFNKQNSLLVAENFASLLPLWVCEKVNHLLGSAGEGEAAHSNYGLGASREEGLRLVVVTWRLECSLLAFRFGFGSFNFRH